MSNTPADPLPTATTPPDPVPADSLPAEPVPAEPVATRAAPIGPSSAELPAAQPPSAGRGPGHRRIGLPRQRRVLVTTGIAVLAGSVLVTALTASASPSAEPDQADRPAACAPQDPTSPRPPAQDPAPTSVSTVEQAYYCIFDNYYGGSRLDDRPLLQYAGQAVVRELRKRGVDQPFAVLPALTGDRDKDWSLFAKRLQEVLDAVPDDDQALRSSLAVAAIQGMLAALHDNHADYQGPGSPGATPDAHPWGLGIGLNRTLPPAATAPDFTGPLFPTTVGTGTPAAAAGLKPGDVIEAVNNVPVFTNGRLNPGVVDSLHPSYPRRAPVTLTVRRPATDRTRRVRVTPGPLPARPKPQVDVTLVAGGIADVRLDAFYPGAAQEALKAIADLKATTKLTGIIFDLRGNRGGVADEGNKLMGAFVHDATAVSFCDADGTCDPQPVDNSTPLLNLPMVTLTDDGCASACEVFATGVKDLHLGALVGTRTAGVNSGPAHLYALNDHTSLIRLPSQRVIGANGEIIDGIGVPPDHYAPLTAADVSTGKDPALDKATAILSS
ncbi:MULTISPECIES: S41 family peptidase [unclassified Streptomyces]|uniref:S41 family peptidase n=1 Tax=unclassified Streptomyces TaxID=2593676 RepID=UPI00336A8C15